MKTTIKFIGAILAVLAFFGMFVVVGLLESDTITCGQCLFYGAIVSGLAWLGLKMANVEEYEG